MEGNAEAKGKLVAMHCDLTKEEDILEMFRAIKDQLGGVDVCVNCAGLSHKAAKLVDGETDKWRDILDVGITCICLCIPFRMTQLFSNILYMKKVVASC